MVTISYQLKDGYVDLWAEDEDYLDSQHELANDKALKHFNDNYYDYKEVDGVLVYDDKHNGKGLLEQQQERVRRIADLKEQLAAMDYKTSKRLDGDYTDEAWQAIVAERKVIRAEIRALEG